MAAAVAGRPVTAAAAAAVGRCRAERVTLKLLPKTRELACAWPRPTVLHLLSKLLSDSAQAQASEPQTPGTKHPAPPALRSLFLVTCPAQAIGRHSASTFYAATWVLGTWLCQELEILCPCPCPGEASPAWYCGELQVERGLHPTGAEKQSK